MMKNKLASEVNKVFLQAFGHTPLTARLDDIRNEFFELMRYTDMNNLSEEAGDMLASIYQLCNESGWNPDDLLKNSLKKIKRREIQYKSLGRKVKVAIYGGAFDPIHNGHIQVAKFVLNTSKAFDEVWLMPCYQHMYGKKLTSANHRLEMCRIAAQADGRIKVCDFEIKNKLSGETYNLMNRMIHDPKYKDTHNFSMIIGQDNANSFDKWVNYENLEKLLRFVVIPRKGVAQNKKSDWYLKEPHIFLNSEETNIIECSSTDIRKALKEKAVYTHLKDQIDKNVLVYIHEKKLY